MKTSPKPSFEILHLVLSLLVKLNSIYDACELVEQQIYVLAYIDSYGKKTRSAEKVLLRTTLTDVLKKVFKCNDNKVSNWMNGLLTQGFLGEITLDKEEIAQLSPVKKGTRSKAVVLDNKGTKKLSFFFAQLRKLRTDLIKHPSVLLPPGADEFGDVGQLVLLLLAGSERT